MKKVFYSVLFLFCLSLNAKFDKSGQTFLFTRPCNQNLGFSQIFWYGTPLDQDHKTGARVDAYYQKSRKADRIKQYFLLANKTEVTFGAQGTATTDALPVWFGLPTALTGNLTFAPEQKQIGGSIDVRHMVGPLFDFDFLKDWWVQLSVALSDVKNNMNLTQSNVTGAAATTNTVYDILTAFKNPDWNYLKIDGERSRSGLSEVRLTLGSTFVSNGRAYASSYSALSLPGKGNTPNTYMFDSQVGFNKHVGIVWGLNLQAPLTRETTNYLITFNINLENNFLIRNHQFRTFDLNDSSGLAITTAPVAKSREWSRYLLMRHKDETGGVTVPGVNVLTHKVRVSPHAIIDFATSLRFSKGRLQAEVGYGLWAHGGDSIKITDTNPWIEEYQIAGATAGQWAKDATLKNRGTSSATFAAIKKTDLNLDSASMLPVAVHRFHAYANLQTEGAKNKMHVGIGGFAEFPRNETKALSTYGIWFNAGGSL